MSELLDGCCRVGVVGRKPRYKQGSGENTSAGGERPPIRTIDPIARSRDTRGHQTLGATRYEQQHFDALQRKVVLNGERLAHGDGVAVDEPGALVIEASTDAEVLLFDMRRD